MRKNIVIGSATLLILFSFLIYDGVKTKSEAKDKIVTTLNEKGYKIKKVEVDISSGRAKAYTAKKVLYIDSVYDKKIVFYEKEYLS